MFKGLLGANVQKKRDSQKVWRRLKLCWNAVLYLLLIESVREEFEFSFLLLTFCDEDL